MAKQSNAKLKHKDCERKRKSKSNQTTEQHEVYKCKKRKTMEHLRMDDRLANVNSSENKCLKSKRRYVESLFIVSA